LFPECLINTFMSKKRLIINKALFEEDKLIIGVVNHQDKIFLINALKKFSIRKSKIPNNIYYFVISTLLLGLFLHKYFYALFFISVLYYLYLKFYKRVYKLILIDTSGKKYTFTFGKKMRSVIFNIRLQIKYKLLVD
jgi:hypothetical protein